MRTVKLTAAEIHRLRQAIDCQILDLMGSGANTPKALESALEKLKPIRRTKSASAKE